MSCKRRQIESGVDRLGTSHATHTGSSASPIRQRHMTDECLASFPLPFGNSKKRADFDHGEESGAEAGAESAAVTERCAWNDNSTTLMLTMVMELDVASIPHSKRQRDKATFEKVQERMRDVGHQFTWQQIMTRWKNLKQMYNRVSLVWFFASLHNKESATTVLSLYQSASFHSVLRK